jgi:hypothetical protein
MRFNLNLAQSFAALACLFLIIIPVVTFLKYYNNADILKIAVLLLIHLISILFFFILPKIKISGEVKRLSFSHFRLSILSLLCLLPLLFFVANSIQGYGLLELAIFSEQYRQGVFSGSGIYTVWSTQILSLILFVILINDGSSKSLIGPVLIIIFASLILGLRVFLWSLVVGYFFIVFNNLTLRKIILVVFFVLFFVLYKYYLSPDNAIAAHDLLIEQLTRPDLHAIVKNKIFAEDVVEIFEYFPFIRYIFGHDLTAFKDYYVPSIPNLNTLMPYVSLYSGVALPGYVILYNSLFVLALIPCVIILSILYNLFILARKTNNLFLKFLCAYLFSVISLMFFEDVNVIYKIEVEIVFVFMSHFFYISILRQSKTSVDDRRVSR